MRNYCPASHWARAAAALAMACYAAAVSAEARMEVFNVPEQQAITGIPEFARQADIQILVPAADVRGVRTAEVIGSFTIREGLQKLLSGTNLAVGSSDNQTVTLKTLDLEHGGAAGSSSASPVVVAQATPGAPVTPTAPRTQAAAVSDGGLEEIVVTATRRESQQHANLNYRALFHRDRAGPDRLHGRHRDCGARLRLHAPVSQRNLSFDPRHLDH